MRMILKPMDDDVPFKLDSITNLPCYVAKNTYQTILDDKSGYDQLQRKNILASKILAEVTNQRPTD